MQGELALYILYGPAGLFKINMRFPRSASGWRPSVFLSLPPWCGFAVQHGADVSVHTLISSLSQRVWKLIKVDSVKHGTFH